MIYPVIWTIHTTKLAEWNLPMNWYTTSYDLLIEKTQVINDLMTIYCPVCELGS